MAREVGKRFKMEKNKYNVYSWEDMKTHNVPSRGNDGKDTEIAKAAIVEMFHRVGLDYTWEQVIEYCKQDEWYMTQVMPDKVLSQFHDEFVKIVMKQKHATEKYASQIVGYELLNWAFTSVSAEKRAEAHAKTTSEIPENDTSFSISQEELNESLKEIENDFKEAFYENIVETTIEEVKPTEETKTRKPRSKKVKVEEVKPIEETKTKKPRSKKVKVEDTKSVKETKKPVIKIKKAHIVK